MASRGQNEENDFEGLFVIGRRTPRDCPARKMQLSFRPLFLVQTNLRHNHPPVQRIFNIFHRVLKCSLGVWSHGEMAWFGMKKLWGVFPNFDEIFVRCQAA